MGRIKGISPLFHQFKLCIIYQELKIKSEPSLMSYRMGTSTHRPTVMLLLGRTKAQLSNCSYCTVHVAHS